MMIVYIKENENVLFLQLSNNFFFTHMTDGISLAKNVNDFSFFLPFFSIRAATASLERFLYS
jgi:hypothetical protein